MSIVYEKIKIKMLQKRDEQVEGPSFFFPFFFFFALTNVRNDKSKELQFFQSTNPKKFAAKSQKAPSQ